MMTSKQQKLDKIVKIWNTDKYWTPPSYQFMADKIGTTKSLVARYVRLLKKEKKI